MSQPAPSKITLEDLLRLKRAERPPAEFWAEFDRELHAKQLAALVEKTPRWTSAIRRLVRISYFPFGATAALALTFVAMRQYRSPATEDSASVAQVPPAAAQMDARPAALIAEAPALPPPSPVAQVQGQAYSQPAPAAVTPATEVVSAVAPPAAATSQEAPTAISWPANALPPAEPAMLMRSIADNLANIHAVDSVFPSGFGAISSIKAHSVADPLTQISTPGETRHARIIAALTDTHLVGAVEPVSVARVRERIASRLAREGYADDISRLGVEGTQVSFKF